MQKRLLGQNGAEVSARAIGTSWQINDLKTWHQSEKH